MVDVTVGELVEVPENEMVVSLFDVVLVDVTDNEDSLLLDITLLDVTNGVNVSSPIDTVLVDITDDTEADVLFEMYTVLVD